MNNPVSFGPYRRYRLGTALQHVKNLATLLQRILTATFRITMQTQTFQHISPVLRNLHWLPLPEGLN